MPGQFGNYLQPAGGIGASAVNSGNLGSGQVSNFAIGSGQVQGIGGTGVPNIASGTLNGFELGSGSVVSGRIGSGQIGNFHVASGQIQGLAGAGVPNIASGTLNGFELGSGSVVSGRVASGQLSTNHLASGATISKAQFVTPVYSGTSWSMVTGENISGVRAVSISQSGNVIVAMAAVSGRMPAVGVVIDNVLSGIPANIYTDGLIFFTSGAFTGIGFFGQPVWVGRSGHLCPMSGSFCSGGYASGDIGQKLGVAVTQSGIASFSSGAVLLRLDLTNWSGGPLGEATGGVI